MWLGELLGLKWSDINLDAAAIMVKHTLTELNGKLFLSEPKTARSRRRVDLPKVAVEALRKHKAKMKAEKFGKLTWAFCSPSAVTSPLQTYSSRCGWAASISMAWARRAWAGGAALWAGLPRAEPAEVQERVAWMCEVVGHNGGYILAGSHHVQADTPIKNLLAVYQ